MFCSRLKTLIRAKWRLLLRAVNGDGGSKRDNFNSVGTTVTSGKAASTTTQKLILISG